MNGRINAKITITSGTPVNIWTQLSSTAMTGSGRLSPCYCRSLSIQAQPSNAGLIQVMDGIYGVQSDGVSPRIPSRTASTDVTAVLGASNSATQPGSQYSDTYNVANSQGGIDVSRCWVDGGSTGDVVIVSYDITENHL